MKLEGGDVAPGSTTYSATVSYKLKWLLTGFRILNVTLAYDRTLNWGTFRVIKVRSFIIVTEQFRWLW